MRVNRMYVSRIGITVYYTILNIKTLEEEAVGGENVKNKKS